MRPWSLATYHAGMAAGDDQQPNLVGELIRRQRELAELPLRQLAALTGISNPYLSQIEHGLRAPSADVMASIANTLGIPLRDLRPENDGVDDEARSRSRGGRARVTARRDSPRSRADSSATPRPGGDLHRDDRGDRRRPSTSTRLTELLRPEPVEGIS